MNDLVGVDAKVERARGHLRRLRGEATAFCKERSRLILPEQCGDRRLWVYRGGEVCLPVRWSIRAGEFAHNLRSALDQLVWQLAAAHGACSGRHGDAPCPGRHNEFPIRTRRDSCRMDIQLCGVGPAARAYIESVQPPRRFRRLRALDGNRVGAGLGMLRDLCNQDKHQSCLQARARWTGQWPRALRQASPTPPLQVHERVPSAAEEAGHELRYGQVLLAVAGGRNWQQLDFPVEAYFDHLLCSEVGMGRNPSIAETLDACMDSVEMVLSRLREEL